jgi:hypothetical protein
MWDEANTEGKDELTMDNGQWTTEEGGIPSLEVLAEMLFERRQEEFICPADWDEASTEWKDVYYSAAAGALDIFRPLITELARVKAESLRVVPMTEDRSPLNMATVVRHATIDGRVVRLERWEDAHG